MDIFLDDRMLDSSATTLPAAIADAMGQAGDRLIIEVTADGAPIPPEHLEHPPTDEPYAGELRFVSADSLSLVRLTLHEAADSLDAALPEHVAIAEMFQVGDSVEALSKLTELLQVWIRIDQALNACRKVAGIGLSDPALADEFNAAADELAPRLAEIRDAVQAQDFTAAADVLAYDLPEHGERWVELLRRIADHLTTAQTDPNADVTHDASSAASGDADTSAA
jgi:hypothetical protein